MGLTRDQRVIKKPLIVAGIFLWFGLARGADAGATGETVEIGARFSSAATIDRGTIRATRIGDGTKIDNQVHVAHQGTGPGGQVAGPRVSLGQLHDERDVEHVVGQAFDVPDAGRYQVNLFLREWWTGASDPGDRVFDVAVEGNVPAAFDDIDPAGDFGFRNGGVVSTTVDVTDDGMVKIFSVDKSAGDEARPFFNLDQTKS